MDWTFKYFLLYRNQQIKRGKYCVTIINIEGEKHFLKFQFVGFNKKGKL